MKTIFLLLAIGLCVSSCSSSLSLEELQKEFSDTFPTEIVMKNSKKNMRLLETLPLEYKETVKSITINDVSNDYSQVFPSLEGFVSLANLSLINSRVKNFDQLKSQSLVELNIDGIDVLNLRFLTNCKRLEEINIWHATTISIPDLSSLSSLSTLFFSLVQHLNLENIDSASNLNRLFLYFIEEIENIDSLLNLKTTELIISSRIMEPYSDQDDTIGTYERYKKWFDENLDTIRNKNGVTVKFSLERDFENY